MELYLSPNDRIDQQVYWRAVLTLFGISAAIAGLGAIMGLLRTEPHDNQHGPGPVGASELFT